MSLACRLGYLGDYLRSNRQRRMRIMSFYELVTSGGIAAGTVVGGFIWEHFERLSLPFSRCLLLSVIHDVSRTKGGADSLIVVNASGSETLLAASAHTRCHFPYPAVVYQRAVGIWLSSQLTFILSTPSHHRGQHVMGSMASLVRPYTEPGVGGFVLSLAVSFILGFFLTVCATSALNS